MCGYRLPQKVVCIALQVHEVTTEPDALWWSLSCICLAASTDTPARQRSNSTARATQEGLAPHIASLEGHWRAQPAGQLAELAVVAVLAAACSRRGTDALRHDDVATPATAILLALCQIAVNGIAVVPPLVRSPEDRCAAALYLTTAMLNHCCAPNASMTFEVSCLCFALHDDYIRTLGALHLLGLACRHMQAAVLSYLGFAMRRLGSSPSPMHHPQDNVLVVRVLRDLQPGEELSHCYGPQTGEHITPLRRRLLRQQYHFECRSVDAPSANC